MCGGYSPVDDCFLVSMNWNYKNGGVAKLFGAIFLPQYVLKPNCESKDDLT